MVSIDKITQKTQNRFVNLYDLDVTHRNGEAAHYYVASRAKTEKDLKLVTRENHPDGVIIYALYGPAHDKVVLIRQYRYTLGDYVYEFPAGLVASATSSSRTARNWRSSSRTATKSAGSSGRKRSRSCARTSSCISLWMRNLSRF